MVEIFAGAAPAFADDAEADTVLGASPKLAKAYAKELRRRNLPEVAEAMREGFPEVLADYAGLGRAIDQTLRERESTRKQRKPSTRHHKAPASSR